MLNLSYCFLKKKIEVFYKKWLNWNNFTLVDVLD